VWSCRGVVWLCVIVAGRVSSADVGGVGIGAYVGANLQIVREIPKAKNRIDKLGADVLDYINVNPEEFNATKHATVKESEMERFIRNRVRNSSRANTAMRRHINDRIKASMQNSGIDTSIFKKSFINEMMNSFDGEKFTTGFDKFLRNKSSLGRNVDSALFSERLTSIEKQASGIIKGVLLIFFDNNSFKDAKYVFTCFDIMLASHNHYVDNFLSFTLREKL